MATNLGADEPIAASHWISSDLDRMYRAEAPRLTRFFQRHLRSADEAPDLVNEAFSKLAQARSVRTIERPLAYLQRVARNLMFDRSRDMIERRSRLISLDADQSPAVEPSQELRLHCADLMTRYQDAISRLTPRTREVFLLHRCGELSYQAIASSLGISSSTVEYHMARALVEIRRSLMQD